MWNIINNINAGAKVFYDKTVDYAGYYLWSDAKKENKVDDKITDYQDIIDIGKYNKEKDNKRLQPKIGLLKEFTIFSKPPTHIIDNIYLGSAFNAASYYTLKELKIKTIFNITKEISNYFKDDFTYVRYNLYDNNKEHIRTYLKDAYKKIRKHQRKEKDNNILIHCFMGASRSATIVIFYLMKRYNYTFDEAFAFIKSLRPIVNPTFRFAKDIAQSTII